MGSSQSVLTPETALTVAVLAGAIGLGYTQLGPSSDSAPGASPAPKIPAKKGKKKKTQVPTSPSSDVSPSNPPPVPSVVPFPAVIPGGFDAAASAAEDLSSSKQSKGKKKKKSKPAASTTIPPAAAPVAAGYNSESSAGRLTPAKAKRQTEPALAPRSLKQSSVSIDTDGSWTRVESGRRVHGGAASASDAPSADLTTSDAGITTPVTGDSSPVLGRTEVEQEEAEGLEYSSRTAAGARRPLAERLLPKPRKTGVDDMLETPDHPTLARVMRVQPRPDEKPASGFSWGDYEDVRVAESAGAGNDADGEDEGWGVVRSKGRPKIDRTPSTSQILTPKAPETLTKRQRQNANKRDTQKALKAEDEAARLATLAKHKRALEKERMIEQLGKSGGKTPSGGMKATVDERGKLVWE